MKKSYFLYNSEIYMTNYKKVYIYTDNEFIPRYDFIDFLVSSDGEKLEFFDSLENLINSLVL